MNIFGHKFIETIEWFLVCVSNWMHASLSFAWCKSTLTECNEMWTMCSDLSKSNPKSWFRKEIPKESFQRMIPILVGHPEKWWLSNEILVK